MKFVASESQSNRLIHSARQAIVGRVDLPRRLRSPVATSLPVLLLLSGCSMIFVDPAPKNYQYLNRFNCTTSYAAPVVATIFALTNIGSVAYVAGQDNTGNQSANRASAITLGVAVAATWAGSAFYGYRSVSECNEAKEEQNGAELSLYRAPFRLSPPAR